MPDTQDQPIEAPIADAPTETVKPFERERFWRENRLTSLLARRNAVLAARAVDLDGLDDEIADVRRQLKELNS
jgi:hypothetical protein